MGFFEKLGLGGKEKPRKGGKLSPAVAGAMLVLAGCSEMPTVTFGQQQRAVEQPDRPLTERASNLRSILENSRQDLNAAQIAVIEEAIRILGQNQELPDALKTRLRDALGAVDADAQSEEGDPGSQGGGIPMYEGETQTVSYEIARSAFGVSNGQARTFPMFAILKDSTTVRLNERLVFAADNSEATGSWNLPKETARIFVNTGPGDSGVFINNVSDTITSNGSIMVESAGSPVVSPPPAAGEGAPELAAGPEVPTVDEVFSSVPNLQRPGAGETGMTVTAAASSDEVTLPAQTTRAILFIWNTDNGQIGSRGRDTAVTQTLGRAGVIDKAGVPNEADFKAYEVTVQNGKIDAISPTEFRDGMRTAIVYHNGTEWVRAGVGSTAEED